MNQSLFYPREALLAFLGASMNDVSINFPGISKLNPWINGTSLSQK